MKGTFVEGLLFGAGFTLSFVVIWYLTALLVWPNLAVSQFEDVFSTQVGESSERSEFRSMPGNAQNDRFHELALDEQIGAASVIVLVGFKHAPEGRIVAIVDEVLKKEPEVVFHYRVGDEYPSLSRPIRENTRYGDGAVVFFTGSPASMRMSMTYSGERIQGLGDLPVALLREKCKEQ